MCSSDLQSGSRAKRTLKADVDDVIRVGSDAGEILGSKVASSRHSVASGRTVRATGAPVHGAASAAAGAAADSSAVADGDSGAAALPMVPPKADKRFIMAARPGSIAAPGASRCGCGGTGRPQWLNETLQ